MRHQIEYYAQKESPLQNAKTRLLKGAPKQGQARKTWVAKTAMLDTPEVRAAWNTLQGEFQQELFLHHHDPK